MNYKASFLGLLFLITLGCKNAKNIDAIKFPAEYSFSKKDGYVNDFDDILTSSQEENIEKLLTQYESETSNEIGVVTVKSIEPFTDIIDFNDALLNNWRFGKEGKYNGLIILIDKKAKHLSIRFGTGLQNKLSDSETQQIIDKVIIPKFKEGNFYEGIVKGINAVKTELK